MIAREDVMRSNVKWFWMEEEGGSVVEIALLSLLFFPIICYAGFFYDFSLANLKMQEASRYAAWELTAMKLWDWKNKSSSLTGTSTQTIKNEIADRWGDDLNSATSVSGASSTPFLYDSSQKKYSGLAMTSLKDVKVDVVDGELKFTGGEYTETEDTSEDGGALSAATGFLQNILSGLGDIGNFAFDGLGFNENGFAKISTSFSLEFDKKGYMVIPGDLLGKNLFSTDNRPTTQRLLVESWDIRGEVIDVDEGFDHPSIDDEGKNVDTDYYAQVKNVFLLGVPSNLGEINLFGDFQLGDLSSIASYIMNFFGIHSPLDPVVRSYRMRGFDGNGGNLTPNKGACYYKTEACIDYDQGPNGSGDNVADPDATKHNSRRKFFTNVYQDISKEDKSPYNKVYKKLGGYYMGCKKDSQKRCEY